MATHDYIIANASGAAVRADLNNALAAIVTNNSSATAPTTTYAYQWWADTTAGQLKLRNSTNTDWVVISELAGAGKIVDGTESAPGLAFINDTDTGVFRPAADELAIATDGEERIRVDDDGNVGLGTDNPTDLLHLKESTPSIKFEGDYGTFQLINNSGGFEIVDSDSNRYIFLDDAEHRIGIGKSFPSSKLDVDGGITVKDNEDISTVRGDLSITVDKVGQSSSKSIKFLNGASEKARIDGNGNLGVGTSAPETLVDIKGTSAPAELQLRTSAQNVDKAKISKVNDGEEELKIESALGVSKRPITFHTNESGERVRIHTTGEVGINTTSPEEKLHVNGNILCETSSTCNLTLGANVGNGNDSTFRFQKTRNEGAVQDNDHLGTIQWQGYYSDEYKTGATIKCEAELGSGSFEGRLEFNSDELQFRTNNVNRMSIDTSGLVDAKGDFRATNGILFGTDTADANKLDDYEEGTWTPAPKLGGGDTGMTYTNSPSGVYTRVGRLVHVRFGFRFSAKGSSTGAFTVEGLPFAVASTGAYNYPTGAVIAQFTSLNKTFACHADGSNLEFKIISSSTGDNNMTDVEFQNNTAVHASIVYQTS